MFKKKKIELPEVEKVTLRPFLGMRPGVYITILAILAILLVVFLVGFLPGIMKGGRYMTFTSPVSSTAVFIDGEYEVSTPNMIFVESGEHEVVYMKDGVVLSEDILDVDHPVFFTWLFHRNGETSPQNISVSHDDMIHIMNRNLEGIDTYSRILMYDSVTHYHPYFTEMAQDMLALNMDRSEIEKYFSVACGYITTVEMLQDAENAQKMLDIDAPYLETARNITAGTETGEAGIAGTVMPLIEPDYSEISNGVLTIKGHSYEGQDDYVMGDKAFAFYPAVNEAGVEVDVAPFSISHSPVTEYEYALFVENNPYWAKSNKEQLIADGMVDENYLGGMILSTRFPSDRLVRNISYNAAEAFARWMGAELPDEITLSYAIDVSPNEYADGTTGYDRNDEFPQALLGGVWEFTSTPYIPLARVLDYGMIVNDAAETGAQLDVVVKGGSSVNFATADTTGSMDRVTCSETTGFRICWR